MEVRWIAAFFIAPIVIVLMIATIVKYLEVWRARSWVKGTARITRSAAGLRERSNPSTGKGQPDVRFVNVPEIAYAFRVGDRHFTGTRITLSEDAGESDVAGTLARYPVGRQVTVYYNKSNPEQAVLERDPPKGLFAAAAWLIAFLIAAAVVAGTGIAWVEAALRKVLPTPSTSPIVLALMVMAGFVLLIARAMRLEAAQADHWSETTGIIANDVDPEGGTSQNIRFAYFYQVNEIDYVGDRAAFGGHTTTRTMGKVIDKRFERYAPGSRVTVYYDPANPAKSVLDRRVEGLILVRGMAAVLAALAVTVALFKGG